MAKRGETILWHDYETTGLDTRRDRPMVFAAQRTDLDLQPIEDPVVVHFELAADVLPNPDACLVTGLDPDRSGTIKELEAARAVHAVMSQHSTCAAGFNSMRFDDEVTRFLFWRNLLPVYEREMRNGNSRWDLIDVLRAACALRPAGMEWPESEPGVPTFRLEELARANGITYAAHDALEDVRATIELARKIRAAQPRLFGDIFECRIRREVRGRLEDFGQEPFVHVSRRFPAAHYCTSLVVWVAERPRIRNLQLCVDLRHDPQIILDLDVDALRAALFMPHAERTDDTPRIGVKGIHVGRLPVMAPRAVLDEASIARTQLDLAACDRHAAFVAENHKAIAAKVAAVFDDDPSDGADVDAALYEGFVEGADEVLCRDVHESPPDAWRALERSFEDERLGELLFRLRARNYPETLGLTEHAKWVEHCKVKMQDAPALLARIVELRAEPGSKVDVLDRVEAAIRKRVAAVGV